MSALLIHKMQSQFMALLTMLAVLFVFHGGHTVRPYPLNACSQAGPCQEFITEQQEVCQFPLID